MPRPRTSRMDAVGQRFHEAMVAFARDPDIRLVPGWFHGVHVELIVSVQRDRDGLHGLPLAVLITSDMDDAVVFEPPHTV